MGSPPLPPLWVVCLLVLCCWTTPGRPTDDVAPIRRTEKICGSLDIRNKVENLRKLANCTVIEGHLQILLIDHGVPSDYDGLSFPDLVEITDYLLLYRAFGLNSLGRLFPSLAVIRGNGLFHNYALVVFEMYQLQELGLSRLTDVLRGSVRIEKNPSLCYVDTVDWDLIAREGKGGHFIKANKKPAECPNTCPENDVCPESPDKTRRLCWNSQNCQRVCSKGECDVNATCWNSTHCCHPECIGGCFGPRSSDCVACRNVMYYDHKNGKRCMKKCPSGLFEYIGRRCVQEQECKSFEAPPKPVEGSINTEPTRIYYKPFDGKCREQCPPGYIVEDSNRHECKRCENKCPKVCGATSIESIDSIKKLKGCTRINGSLQIHIQGGSNVIKELEESLSMIEQIDGYLKIARSFPLVSLHFLKSLHTIMGYTSDKNYTLLVLDNQNLQELWDWKNRDTKLRILGGKVFFHFNSKLCPSKIAELKKYAETAEWDDRDVSPSSNGDRVACDVTNMNVTVRNLTPTMVLVRWESIHKLLYDERSLLGYVIYYRESPYKNISLFEGRDACGTDVWTVRDVEIVENTNLIEYHIQGLEPFTQYALYIRTYTTASGRQGAQSSIVYFKTMSGIPTQPVSIKARSTLHGEIVISWKPPKHPNGNVTHYIIEGIYEKDPSYFAYQRNYCAEPLSFPEYKKNLYEEDDSKHFGIFDNVTSSSLDSSAEGVECCSCSKDQRKLGEDDLEAESQIIFEDFLHNQVYVKNTNISRSRRHATTTFSSPEDLRTATSDDDDAFPIAGGDRYENGSLVHFRRSVYFHTFLVVSNLRHFSEYTIEIKACQDGKTEKNICSTKAITSVRTLPLAGADDVPSHTLYIQMENLTYSGALAKWEEPKDSNGIIVAYTVEYRKLNVENYTPQRICVTRASYLVSNGYILSDLSAGNYSVRVRATSLAGHGNWSSDVFFAVHDARANYTFETLLSVGIITFLVITMMSGYMVYRWKFAPRIPDDVDYASVNPEYKSFNFVYEPDEWEIDRDKVQLLEELGNGSFGMVYKGKLHGINGKAPILCAAKTVNETASLRDKIEFLQEASVMKAFNCHHVIKLLGVVSKGQPTLVIMELMTNGDLKCYLRKQRPDDEENPGQVPPSLRQILQMAANIADGMAYLAAKKFVHRDLAARNCMVAEDLTVKIGDFGMTRDIYENDYYRKGGKGFLPVRWMSPESLKDGIFDSQTDVWSYGVVLWEMATLASQPYQGLSNEDVLKFVIAGNTMEKPEDCPEKLYDLMLMCWHKNAKARPTFVELVEMLLPDVNSKFSDNSFYHTQRLSSSNHMDVAEDDSTPDTPLHATSTNQNEDASNEYRYFPGISRFTYHSPANGDGPVAVSIENDYPEQWTVEQPRSNSVTVNSSDGSKDSKVSSLSNGSVANGHVVAHFQNKKGK